VFILSTIRFQGFYWRLQINLIFGCYNVLSSACSLIAGKDATLAKVNYQYEKRQKELEKKRKKEQKEREKQKRKNNPSQETAVTEVAQETPPIQQPEK